MSPTHLTGHAGAAGEPERLSAQQAAQRMVGAMRPAYRLAKPWRQQMERLNIPTAAVEALAGQGAVVEAYLLLRDRLAEPGTGATHCRLPATPPFEALPRPCPVATGAAPHPQQHGEAVGAPAPSAGNAGPKAAAPAAPGERPQRARLFVRSVRFRPLVSFQGRRAALQQGGLIHTRGEASFCLEALLREAFQ